MKIIKNISIIGFCLCSGFLVGYGVNNEAGSRIENEAGSEHEKILVDDNMVKIEYIKNVSRETFDLLITPKQGYNVSAEFSMIDTVNYKDAYITGWSITQASQFFATNPNYKNIPFSWNQ